MDPFESRLKFLPLRQPSERFGRPETLTGLCAKWDRPQVILQRINAMPWTSKAATLVAMASIGFVLYLVLAAPAGSSVAFAQVAEKLHAAKTVSFDSVITSAADGKTLHKSRDYYMSPGKSRHEFLFPESETGAVSVEDFVAGSSMVVSGKLKTAILGSIKGGAEIDKGKKMMDYLQSLPTKNPRQLGEKQIEGVPAKGFAVEAPGETTTVWANATTGDPVRIEILHKNIPGGPQLEVMTNIKLDEKLDPAMFSVAPPQGYQVRQNASLDLNAGPAHWASQLLKTYAKYMDGEFPTTLDKDGLEPLYQKLLKSGVLKPDQLPSEDDLLQLPAYSAAVGAMTMRLKAGERWQYYSGGKLGQKDRIVFWYLDKKTDAYSAVYGDLRVEKVAKDQLPSAGAADE
jgi:outer membrane lipoprotein-sorting protein